MKRKILITFFFISIIFAGFSCFYKTKHLGFSINPSNQEHLWTIESHVSFEPIKDQNIKISLAIPPSSNHYKILESDTLAQGYKKQIIDNTLILKSGPKEQTQDIYNKILVFDNVNNKGKIWQEAPRTPATPMLEESKLNAAKKILSLAKKQPTNIAQSLISLINQDPINPTLLLFLPPKKTEANTIEAIITLLHLNKTPARVVRGIKLEENKNSLTPDIMLETYINGAWRVYDINTGQSGLPKDFIIIKKGGHGLLDIEGGQNSTQKLSAIKSVAPSLTLAKQRAKLIHLEKLFNYSIYNLPLSSQNTIKWLSIFPLAILIVVILRNVIGLKTMGTFTPMLIALSLVETGLIQGICIFGIMVSIGLILRSFLSKLNLLLVPRISAVVVFVILLMQTLAILGFNLEIKTAQDAVFFPIIIMAWIIERASITWEEDGAKNALEEIFYSVLVAIITYFVIKSPEIRHIMFAFNELNLVILAIIMLLGTYTGYRLTELFRFKSLGKK